MTYLLKGDGEKDRELTKEEYSFLLEKLVEIRMDNYFRELIR